MTIYAPKYFDDETGEAIYKTQLHFSAFDYLKRCELSDWSPNNKSFLSAMMKMAFSDGIEAGKAEVRENLDGIYKAIGIFLQNGNQDY